ncbi:DUF481 domain-containing protein [Tamlana fucoidanivorans]|uniref:DUF481 domain-containing protein n=1 Tax=Allotamlana fucoidanivorans TaxID=2583814 RepID=A0A5C4SG23_9FLAO|nr:DUF481 domain-containing protein [Tamlana fucoidanivorans]TNJ42518.1 DUF481 domain-containing protein [Tamlana fucoidanivorans]
MYKSLLFLVLLPVFGFSQKDTIRLKDNSILVGEVKRLSKAVLTVKTSYSDKDFRVQYSKVESLDIQKKCLIMLTKGRRRFGNLTTDKNGYARITLLDGTPEYYVISEIVALDEIDDRFWKRVKVSVDLGLNIAKANNYKQFSTAGSLSYMDNKWVVNGSISVLNSRQDNVDNVKRTDAKLSFYRILNRKWYLLGNTSFLSNTEQALVGRTSPSAGVGRFLIATNKLFFSTTLGYTYNIENYTDNSLNKTSSELLISGTFNVFDLEDLSLETTLSIFPSLSESRRVRSDYNLTLKYDLPLDFYLKLGFTLNYDNQPAVVGNDTDYNITTGFGWSFN